MSSPSLDVAPRLSVYAREHSRWSVADWLSRYLYVDLITLWENRADAPGATGVSGEAVLEWINDNGTLLFGDEHAVWSYGRSVGQGPSGYLAICDQLVDNLCTLWNIDINWSLVASQLPIDASGMAEEFRVPYQNTIIHTGGDMWATFNGLYFDMNGSGEGKTGISSVVDRMTAHIYALRIVEKMAQRWVNERTNHLMNVNGVARNAAYAQAVEPFAAFFSLATQFGTVAFESGILSLLKRRSITMDDLNTTPAQGTLTLTNGTFYLDQDRTVKWSTARGDHLAALKNSRVVPHTWPGPETTYNEEQLAELWQGTPWEQFLIDTIPHEGDRMRVAMAVGDCIFGQQQAKFITILKGHKDSGKTVLIKALSHVLGSYGEPMPMDLIMKSKGFGDKFATEPLRGRRLGSATEGEQGRTLNATALKAISGRDEMQSRDLNQSYKMLTPEISLFFATNEVPQFSATDTAFADRLLWINMALRDGVPKRSEIFDEMKAQYVAILAWALWGATAAEPLALLRKLRDEGTAEDSTEHLAETNIALLVMLACFENGVLRAVGTPEEWDDWRTIDPSTHRELHTGTGTARSESLGGATSRRIAAMLKEEGELHPRTPGAAPALLKAVLQRMVLYYNDNRHEFSGRGYELTLPNKGVLGELIAKFFGGAQQTPAGPVLMGVEIPTITGTGRF